MATLKPRLNKDGTTSHIVQIRRKGYPAISKSFPTEKEARDWAIITEAAVMKNENPNPQEKTKWTIPEVVAWYKENPNPHRKLETRKHFQRLDFVAKEFEHFTVMSLTPALLQRWVNKRLTINAPATVYHYFVALRNVLEHHSVMHSYNQNIFQVVSCPTTSGERDFRFNDDELRELIRVVKSRAYTKKTEFILTVIFSIHMACRIGEMLKLRWQNVDLKKEEAKFIRTDTKTKYERYVPLDTTCTKILHWIKKHYPHKPQDRVFSFYHLNEHHLSRQFKIVLGWIQEKHTDEKDLKVNPIYVNEDTFRTIKQKRWHDLRHEGASRLYEKTTLTDMEIALITGHKSLDMLSKYAHLRPSNIRAKLK